MSMAYLADLGTDHYKKYSCNRPTRASLGLPEEGYFTITELTCGNSAILTQKVAKSIQGGDAVPYYHYQGADLNLVSSEFNGTPAGHRWNVTHKSRNILLRGVIDNLEIRDSELL